ncbi:MAG: hypothetical protein HY876_10205 [Coriobacteriales bacterium]|nr:hypothetical protein [Coriobacteriales bacterium]
MGIVALLALCGCAAVVIGFMGSAADTTKKYEAAEVHYAAAVTALAVLDDAEQLASADDLATMADEWDAKVTPGVEAAQNELELAAAELDDVDESEAKTAYLASLKSSQALLSEMGKLSDELDTLADVGQDIDSLGKRLVKANASLDSAVADTQDRKWGSCITKAESARANYRTAEAQLRKLHKRYSSFGFNKIAADTAIRRQAAERIIAVAKAGRAGNISRANDLIGSYNALARRTGKVDTDALEPNALLENFWASYKEISKQLIAAEVAHDQAIKAIESGKY